MIFQLFKNKYLDLDTNFSKQHLLFSDAIILSTKITLDQNSRYISKSSNLHTLISSNYNSSLELFFNDFFCYHSDRPSVIYCEIKDFKYLIVSFFKSLYPNQNKEIIYKICDLTFDKLFLIENINIEFSKQEFEVIYQIADNNLIKEEMVEFLPFEIRYGDYKFFKKPKTYQSLIKDIEKIALKEMKEMLREIKNFFITYPHEKLFKSEKESLREMFKKSYPFIFDPLVFNCDTDEDVYKIIEIYGIDHISELYVKTFESDINRGISGNIILAMPLSGSLPKYNIEFLNINNSTINDCIKNLIRDKQIKNKLRIIKDRDFESLIDNKEWIESVMQMSSHRRRINFFLLNYLSDNPISLSF
jgi:hypothetical protein